LQVGEGRLAGDIRVLRERAVRFLLAEEQEVPGARGTGGVAVGDERCGDL